MARDLLLYMAQAKAGPDAAGPGKAKRDEVGRHAPGKATVRGAGARGAAGGLAGWALYVTLGAMLSAGTCAAAQFGANGPATRANREIGPTPLEAPIDATMARIARFEKVPGFDPAHLSAASRNLFSLAGRCGKLVQYAFSLNSLSSRAHKNNDSVRRALRDPAN
jgi:hypothetical protein